MVYHIAIHYILSRLYSGKNNLFIVRLIALAVFAVLISSGCMTWWQTQETEIGDAGMETMVLTSPAFGEGASIPSKYTCDGADVNPPLRIGGVPQGAKSLVLMVHDPDAPGGDWIHWLVYDIKPGTTDISEDSVPGVEGMNDFRRQGWGGPCPPSGTHRYVFKIYALNSTLGLPLTAGKSELFAALRGRVLALAQLTGTYRRL
jgi:Raf kinase inhibitor-like YbhB/YbcL family protein